jgi:hypothetical protein
MIAALDRHRRGPRPRAPEEGWPVALSKFVAEHARNAGSTLYLLRFEPDDSRPLRNPAQTTTAVFLSEVRLRPEGWLVEGKPTVVG